MGAIGFDELAKHLGHRISTVMYGIGPDAEAEFVALECEDCRETLLELGRGEKAGTQYVVMVGTLSDGFYALGPFPTWAAADAAAPGFDTWIMAMSPTNEDDDAETETSATS